MAIILENADVETADVLAALHRGCMDPDGERAWSAAEFADLLRLPTIWAAVALDGRDNDRGPVGFILCSSAGDEGEVLFIGVLPHGRRCGTGHALLSAALGVARRHGLRRVMLEVAADNVAASRLYSKFAFTPCGRRSGYYTRRNGPAIDAIIMRAAL